MALSISVVAGKRVEDYPKLQTMTDQIVDDVLCDAGRPEPDQRR
ncbi:hypothetical protein [Actinomadura sp. 6N118]